MPNHVFAKEYNKERFIQMADSPSIDAFGRQRVSNPYTVFDSKQLFGPQSLFFDDQETSGGGTSSSHDPNKASTTIGVSAATAGKRVRQTFQRFNYRPGKSQQVLITGVFVDQSDDLTDIEAQIGLFDDNNGLFFSLEEGTMKVVRRTYVTGAAVDNKVSQSDWNIDPMNGSGPSKINLDYTKTQIIIIDFEWLGVGRVRFGWVVDGVIYYCHQLLNANNLSNVYMSTPNLPIRYSIEATGTSGVATSMQHICCTVISEGGDQEIGDLFYISNGVTEVSCTTAGTYYATKGMRLKASHIGATIIPVSVSIVATASTEFEWQLRLNPTVGDTFTYSDITNACIQEATGDSLNTVSGGTIIAGGYGVTGGAGGNARGGVSLGVDTAQKVGAAIDGTLDTIVLCVTCNDDGIGVLTGMNIRQLA